MKKIFILIYILLMQTIILSSNEQSLFFWFRSGNEGQIINRFPFLDDIYKSDFLVYLNLLPNKSTGQFQIKTNNGITNIQDKLNYIDNDNSELIIKVYQIENNLVITYLFGENEYIWNILNLTDYFIGINLKFLEIQLNDFIGNIKIYNNSGYGLRCKLIEVNGHSNGFEINKNSNEMYTIINGKWKQKKLK